jgi:hypothetical protein
MSATQSDDSIPIPMEDALVHTDEYPFCDDPSCWCHEDETLIAEIAAQVEGGLLTPEEATDLVNGRTRSRFSAHQEMRQGMHPFLCS